MIYYSVILLLLLLLSCAFSIPLPYSAFNEIVLVTGFSSHNRIIPGLQQVNCMDSYRFCVEDFKVIDCEKGSDDYYIVVDGILTSYGWECHGLGDVIIEKFICEAYHDRNTTIVLPKTCGVFYKNKPTEGFLILFIILAIVAAFIMSCKIYFLCHQREPCN